MEYQALYRKWRPKIFEDVLGQTHITETLKNQVAGGKLTLSYNNDTTEEIDLSAAEVTGFDKNLVGEQELVV